jgi:hypothetical protein
MPISPTETPSIRTSSPNLRRLLNPNAAKTTAREVAGHHFDESGCNAAVAPPLTVSVVETGSKGFPVSVAGENEQDVPAGNPLQLKLTCPLNANWEVRVTVLVMDWPPEIVMFWVESDRVKFGGRVYVADAIALFAYP